MIFIAVGARALLGVVFLIAFASKVRSPSAFADFSASLAGLAWVPERLRRPTAWAVVLAEAAVVTLVALPALVWAGLVLASVVLIAFTATTYRAVRRGVQVRCHCFGASNATLGPAQLVRDFALVGVALAGLSATAGSYSGASASAPTLALAALTGALVGAVLTRWDDLAFLFTSTGPRDSA